MNDRRKHAAAAKQTRKSQLKAAMSAHPATARPFQHYPRWMLSAPEFVPASTMSFQ